MMHGLVSQAGFAGGPAFRPFVRPVRVLLYKVEIQMFLSRPTRARLFSVLGAEVALGLLLSWSGVLPLSITLCVFVLTALSLLEDGSGSIRNLASVIAGRPIAITRRGRKLVDLNDLTPGQRREAVVFVAALVMLAVVTVSRD